MKTIFKSTILLAVVGLTLFTSCKDDNDSNPVLGTPTTFVLNTPAYSTVPVDLASSTEIPFTWSSPDYGFPVEAEFQLEASIDGNFTVSVEEADADESGETIPNYVVLPTVFTGGHGAIPCGSLAVASIRWEIGPKVKLLLHRRWWSAPLQRLRTLVRFPSILTQ